MFLFLYGIFGGCSGEGISVEEEIPDSWCRSTNSYQVSIDEIVHPDWSVSVEDILNELNTFDTCIWEYDGSSTKISFAKYSGYLDHITVWEYEDENKTHYCPPKVSFPMEVSFYLENDEVLDLFVEPLFIKENRFQGYGYHNIAYWHLPPFRDNSEEILYTTSIFSVGNFKDGEVESVTFHTGPEGGQTDKATCYKE